MTWASHGLHSFLLLISVGVGFGVSHVLDKNYVSLPPVVFYVFCMFFHADGDPFSDGCSRPRICHPGLKVVIEDLQWLFWLFWASSGYSRVVYTPLSSTPRDKKGLAARRNQFSPCKQNQELP